LVKEKKTCVTLIKRIAVTRMNKSDGMDRKKLREREEKGNLRLHLGGKIFWH